MIKPTKIFIISIASVISLLTILVFLTTAFPVRPTGQVAVKQPPVDMAKVESEYKSAAKAVIADFLKLAESDQQATVEQIRRTKDQLLKLTVPPALKQLHLDLVLATDKMIAFVQGLDKKGKVASIDIIKKAKTNYDWLN